MVISGLQKLTLLDYPGHTACTVFTPYCNWRCPFCHNAVLVLRPEEQPVMDPEEIFAFLRKRKGLLDGVAVTGGEPTLHKDLRPQRPDPALQPGDQPGGQEIRLAPYRRQDIYVSLRPRLEGGYVFCGEATEPNSRICREKAFYGGGLAHLHRTGEKDVHGENLRFPGLLPGYEYK